MSKKFEVVGTVPHHAGEPKYDWAEIAQVARDNPSLWVKHPDLVPTNYRTLVSRGLIAPLRASDDGIFQATVRETGKMRRGYGEFYIIFHPSEGKTNA